MFRLPRRWFVMKNPGWDTLHLAYKWEHGTVARTTYTETACGDRKAARWGERVEGGIDAVTCGRCMRTARYRVAAREERKLTEGMPANAEMPERYVLVAGMLTHTWQDGLRHPAVVLLDKEGMVDWSTLFYVETDGDLNVTDERIRGMRDGPRPGR